MQTSLSDLISSHLDLVYSYTAFLLAYLIGSISFAVVVSKAMRLPDPRTFGSGNPGATNVLRSGSKVAAVLTLLFDALKGFVPTALASRFAFELGFEDTTIAFVGVSAFLGHLFPVFHRFRGGKGVATALGVLLALQPLVGIAAALIWLAVAAVFRYSSLASIVAAVFAPILMWMFVDRPMFTLGVGLMSLLLLWRHARNILQLVRGVESKIGESEAESQRKRRRRKMRRRLHEDHGVAEFQASRLAADDERAPRTRGARHGKRRKEA